MKTLTSFKRVMKENVGRVKLTLIGFTINGNPASHRFMTITRRVMGVGSSYMVVESHIPDGEPSYLEWPKAKDYTYYPDSKSVAMGVGPLVMTYLIEGI